MGTPGAFLGKEASGAERVRGGAGDEVREITESLTGQPLEGHRRNTRSRGKVLRALRRGLI